MLFVLLMFFTAGCQASGGEGYTSEEFVKIVNSSDSSKVILDVRTPPELTGELAKVEGAINIPLQELQSRANELEKYRDKEIVVVCRSGRRSAAATEILKKNNYNAVNVQGGMLGYKKAGGK